MVRPLKLAATLRRLMLVSAILIGPFAGCASSVIAEKRLEAVEKASDEGPSPPRSKSTAPQPKVHSLSLSGRALTADGKPLAGATIFVVSTNRIEQTLGQTTTDQEGRYSFRDLPLPVPVETNPNYIVNAVFEVFGRAPGMAIAWQGMKSIRLDPRYERDADSPPSTDYFPGDKVVLDLTFEKPQPVSGRFLDERGQPIAGVTVQLASCDYLDVSNSEPRTDDRRFWALCQAAELIRDDIIATSDSDGKFHLKSIPADRICWLSIEHPDHARKSVYVATSQRKVLEHFGQPVAPLPLEMTLHATKACRVQMVFADTEQPAAGVRVVARQMRATGYSHYETSDDAGKLLLRLPPGTYEFDCSPPQTSDYVKTIGKYTVAADPAEQSLVVKVDRGCVLLLKAVDEKTGKGVAGVDFWNEVTEPRRGHTGLRSTTGGPNLTTNADGVLRAVVYPGKRRFGMGFSPLPEGYEIANPADAVFGKGRTLVLGAGETATAEFKLGRSGVNRKLENSDGFDFDFLPPHGEGKPYP
ncbi:MAG: polymerase sigma factor, sigma-70 family [Planctomycetaceae bacterium]|nr:polymerase sigma factor, sigma-70 family [Planctomycetaceae bacterium]